MEKVSISFGISEGFFCYIIFNFTHYNQIYVVTIVVTSTILDGINYYIFEFREYKMYL